MKLGTAFFLVVCVWQYSTTACPAQQSSKTNVDDEKQRFLLTINLVHSVTRDAIQQDIIVKEGESFFVSTLVGEVRWTLSGDVGRVVHNHLPILLRSQWRKKAESDQTLESPRLVKVNAGPTLHGGAINGLGFSLAARDTTESYGRNKLPASEVMREALQRQINDLKKAQERGKTNGAGRRQNTNIQRTPQ